MLMFNNFHLYPKDVHVTFAAFWSNPNPQIVRSIPNNPASTRPSRLDGPSTSRTANNRKINYMY